jgi:pantoate--beta-alanine ligase
VREPDGLALSSRNRYLSPDERRWAAQIPRALRTMADLAATRETRIGELLDAASAALSRVPLQIEYLGIASERDLQPVGRDTRLSAVLAPRAFVAARAGATRLIDNQPLVPIGARA